jgi:hypothetical protein
MIGLPGLLLVPTHSASNGCDREAGQGLPMAHSWFEYKQGRGSGGSRCCVTALPRGSIEAFVSTNRGERQLVLCRGTSRIVIRSSFLVVWSCFYVVFMIMDHDKSK